MSQSLLVFILSVLVFVIGAVFINYTVKKDEAADKQAAQLTEKKDNMKKAA